MKLLIVAIAAIAAARLVSAEVAVIRGGESTQPGGEQSFVIINTNDRSTVPLMSTTKQSKSDAGTRIETVTRLRSADGSYFDWRRSSDVEREVSPGKTERTAEIVERDRQGGERARKLIKQSTTTTSDAKRSTTTEYRRDSSGRLILSHETSTTSTKGRDGIVSETRMESDYDVNGRPVLTRQIEAVTTSDLATRSKTTVSTTRSLSHLEGGVSVTLRETATVRADGNTTHAETLKQKPNGAGWENDQRILSVETRTADGTTQRETIVEGRSMYARQAGSRADNESLIPQTKTVEHQVRQSDGTVLVHRDIYRRDVNGDWKPTTFSTEAAQTEN